MPPLRTRAGTMAHAPLRRQDDFAAFVGVLDAAAAGAFMHRLADLRLGPAHEALAVGQALAARVQAAVNDVHSVPVRPLR